VAQGASVPASATVDGSIVAADVVVGDRAVVTGSVLLDGARIGADARVTGSVVMGCVRDGASIEGSVIGAGAVVTAAESLVGAKRPDPASDVT
jgi:mannose-1-phosphate guanylyltransferase